MKLIKLSDTHYIVVDDSSEMKDGDYIFRVDVNYYNEIDEIDNWFKSIKKTTKIIYSTLPIENYHEQKEKGFIYKLVKPLSLSEVKEEVNGSTPKTEWECTISAEGKLFLVR